MKFVISLGLMTFLVACAEESKFKADANRRPASMSDAEGDTADSETKNSDSTTVDGSKSGNKPATTDGATGKNPSTIDGDAGKPITQTFAVATQKGKVDMFWVIDTSGSMAQEIAEVKRNFQGFMTSLGARIDIQVTLLASKETAIEALVSPHAHVATVVQSHDAMQVLAASLCPKDQTTIDSGTSAKMLCGQAVTRLLSTRTPADYVGLSGERLRSDANRVFVFVTDDNARGFVTAANFLTLTASDPATTRAYAFAGKKESKCGIAAEGVEYEAFSAATQGEVFDICATDWSANFTKLSESVIRLASNKFMLKALAGIKIASVELDGVAIPEDAYSFDGKAVVIKDEAKLLAAKEVKVTYSVEK